MRSISFTCVAAALFAVASLVQAAPLVNKGESIAFMGDSITQFGAATPGGYVHLVESGLAANGIDIKIIPAGISGNKSDQMLARLDGQVLKRKPAWMTLSCGVNDVWHGANGIPLDAYKKNITEIVDRCEKAGVKVMILTSTQIGLPVTNPNNVKLADYNAFLHALAAERKLPLADLNADMLAEQEAFKAAGNKHSLTVDGVHMNTYGNIMMARGVLKAFGLDAAQLVTAEKHWQTIPDAVQLATKVKLSIPESEALEAIAASRNKTVDALISEQADAAVKALLAKP